MKGEYIWIVFLFLVGGCSSKSTGDIMDISVNIESEGRMSEYFQEARLHNNANVCCIPARFISFDDAQDIVERFLSTEFEGGRHQRRIEKIPLK